MSKEEKETPPDIGLYFDTEPPLVVPLSDRAKEIMNLQHGADCAMYPGVDPDRILIQFQEEYIVTHLEKYDAKLIAVLELNTLH